MKKIARALLCIATLCSSLYGTAQTLPGDSIVFGPMLSPVYNDTVRVWILTKDSTNTGDSLAIELTGASSPNTPLTGTVYNSDSRLGYHLRSYKYGGLTAGETYTAVIKKNNVAMYRSASIENGVNQLSDFSFLAGGCGRIFDTTRCMDLPAYTSGSYIDGTPEIFNQMATENSDMMVWLGDAVYLLGLQHANGQCPNGVDDWANKNMAFDRYKFVRQYHDSLIRAMPQLAITDNHDVGPDEYNYDMATLGEMREIFMDWWPNPEYLSTQAGQGMFSSYKYKDVEFFLTDNRSYRTGTLAHFGAEQQAWLKQALLNSDATFKVIISGTPVFNPNWGGRNYSYSSQGADLRQYIQDNNIDGVIAFSADIHAQQFYGSYQYKYPLYDVLSGNLASDVGNNPSYSVDYTSNAIMSGVKQTYVKVSLEGDATDRRMKIAYTDTAGVPYFSSYVHAEMLTSVDDSVKHVDLGFSSSTYDSSSYHHTLNATGLSYVEDRHQNAGSAAYFGSNTNVQVPYQQSWNMQDRAFSLTYWAKPAQYGSKSAVFSTGSTTNGFTIGFDEDGYPEYTDHATGTTYTSSRSLLTNKWSHLTWIYDNVKRHLELYFNGMMIESWEGVISSVESTSNIYIGQSSQGQHYKGALDEVNVYGKLISAETIQLEAENETVSEVLSLGGSQNMEIPGSVVNSLLANDYTVEFWAKLNSDPCSSCKILSSNGRDGNNNTTGLTFEYNSSNQLIIGNGTGGSGWNTITNVNEVWSVGEWNHVAYTAEANGSMKLYINGELSGSGTYTSYASNSWGFGLGYSPYYSGTVDAEMDELRIWTAALSQDSIQSRMHYKLSGNETDLGLYYDFTAYTDSTIMSSGNTNYEILLDGASLISATSPVATVDAAYLSEVTGNWSIAVNDNNGLSLLDNIGDYITNMVVGHGIDTVVAVYDSTNNQYYSTAGWQIVQNNLPFANLSINLDQAIPQSDSIEAIASNYYLLEEDTAGNFSIISTGSYDGQNVNFYNAYIAGGYYYLAFEVDTSGTTNRGSMLALNANYDVVLPHAVIDSVFSEAFTIETWFRVNANAQDKKIISCHGKINGISKGFTFEMPNNSSMIPNVVFGTNTGSWNAATANTAINIGEWNHMAVTVIPNDSFRIYINGELTNTTAFDTYVPSGTWDLAFGKSQNYGNGVLSDFDEFRIYSRALTQQEIKDGMHLSMDASDTTLVYNLTFDQDDNGYIQNTSSVLLDSVAYTNASIVTATTPVSAMDAAYRNTVRGSWSVDANNENGLYVDNNITSYTSNLVVGRAFDDAVVALPSTNDTFYVEGAWLVNTLEMDSADIAIDLYQALSNADSIELYATEYYLIFGDPQSNYTILGVDTAVNGIVEFDDVPVEYGTYRIAFLSDEQNVINQLGGELELSANHNVVINNSVADQLMSSANGFTLETWFKVTETISGGEKMLASHIKPNSQSKGMTFEFPGGSATPIIGFGTNTNSWNSASTNTSINTGEWNHLSLSVTPNDSFRIYINGDLVNTQAFTQYYPSNSMDLAFGTSQNYGNGILTDFDEFRIWNRPKTAAEIQEEMYRELPAGYDTTLKINLSFNQVQNGYVYNTGTPNVLDSILLTNAGIVPATDPVRVMNAPYTTTVSGNWSVRSDSYGGFYLGNTLSDYSSNVVVGRDLDYSISQIGTQDTSYVNGAWYADLRNYSNEVNSVVVDLEQAMTNPDSVLNITNTFYLIKGTPNGSNYSFVAEASPVGYLVTFDSVTIDTGVYTLAWREEILTPLAAFVADTTVVIQGNAVTYYDMSSNLPDTLTWTFEGGNPYTATGDSISVVYDTLGYYTTQLIASNQAGSDTAVYQQYIQVIEPAPVVDFAADTTLVIVGNTATFSDSSTNNPTALVWTFAGGMPATSTDTMPTVTYNTTGVYDVTLIASNQAGSDTLTKSMYINVTEPAPIADFVAQDTFLIQGDSTVFTDLTINNPDSVRWVFAGGTPATSTDTMPTVTYGTGYGYFDVTLIAYNQAGTDTMIKAMYIHVIEPAPVADFEADTTIVVAGDSTFFTDLSSHHPDSLFWIFAGGSPVTSTDTMPYVTYNATGFYDVTLMAYNPAGSGTELKTQYIQVIEPAPVADFVANDTLIVEGNATTFTDLSTNNPDSVHWAFSGGSPATSTNVAPSVTYATSGYYDVTLTAYNQAGSDTLTKLMYIHVIEPAPVADFEADTTVVIAGNSTFFTDLSAHHPDSLYWIFSGGTPSISTDTMPTVSYTTPGVYSVTLYAYNQAGMGIETKVDYIEVIAPAPVANFMGNATVVVAGDTVTFTDLSTNSPDSLVWTFAGGSPATSNDTAPEVVYDVPGVYAVTLAAFNAAGGDTTTKATYITVLDPVPVASFIADQTSIFTGDSVTFTDLSTNNPTAWSWIFSGGSPATSSDSMPVVQYNTPGLYDVTLISSNQAGASTPDVWSSYIEVNERTSIEENLSNGTAISWYPNPTSGNIAFSINANGGEAVTVELYDITARKVARLLTDNAAGGAQQWTFNIADYVSNTQTLIMIVSIDGEISRHIVQFVE